MLGNRFLIPGSDEYISYDIICDYYVSDTVFFFRNSRDHTTLHPSFGHLDYFYIFEFMEFDEFLNRFDEFGIDLYRLLSSLFPEKCQKRINMLDRRDIDPE